MFGRPKQKKKFVPVKAHITFADIPNRVLAERARRNGWSQSKIEAVAISEGDMLITKLAQSLGLKKDAIPCERCDLPVNAGDLQFLPDGSPSHLYDCLK